MESALFRPLALVAAIAFVSAPFRTDAAEPLTLRQAIAAALQGNPKLQTFAFRLRVGDARLVQARLTPPLEASIELENFAGSGGTAGFDAAESTFALSKVIELGGKRDARVGVAQADRDVIDVEKQASQLDVLTEVARRFIAVAQSQQRVQLARTATELSAKIVSASERRVEAAKSPHAELDRARIAFDRSRLAERGALLELDAARRQLAATWGQVEPVIDGRSFGDVQADLFELPSPGDFETLVARITGHPDFLRFASEARLRDAESRLAASGRRPDLTLGVGLRRFESTGEQAFVASLSVPLFAGRRAEGLLAETKAASELTGAERRAAEVKAKATLYELHRQMTRAVLEAQTLKDDIRPRSAEALKETEYAYERGRYSYLELVDAQREYLAVEAALIDAAAAAHTLRAEVERLTNSALEGAAP